MIHGKYSAFEFLKAISARIIFQASELGFEKTGPARVIRMALAKKVDHIGAALVGQGDIA